MAQANNTNYIPPSTSVSSTSLGSVINTTQSSSSQTSQSSTDLGSGQIATTTSVATTVTTTKAITTSAEITEVTKYDNGVLDISIIPFMRRNKINFRANGLKPNRRVWFFFDDVDVTNWIQPADEVVLNTMASALPYPSQLQTPIESILFGSNTSYILGVSRYYDYANANTALHDTGDDRDRPRKLYLDRGFITNTTIQGNPATVSTLKISGGSVVSVGSNTIVLSTKTSGLSDNWYGTNSANSVLVTSWGDSPYQAYRANIQSFTKSTRTLVFDTFSNIALPASYMASGNGSDIVDVWWKVDQPIYTDDEGNVVGTFWLPGGAFRTGERIFRIIDTPTNDINSAQTYVNYKFDATGVQQTKQMIDLVNKSISSNTVVSSSAYTTTSSSTVVTPPTAISDGQQHNNGGHFGQDPIAESFSISKVLHPDGVFVTGLDLFFRSKDNILPVSVEIRPLENGYPSAASIVTGGFATVVSENVTLSENCTSATRFTFPKPVYIPPGEYCFVVRSDSLNYELFVSELGQTIIGSTSIVSKQPFLGSLFKSQNATTWDAIQTEDICFNLYIASFTSTGQLNFQTNDPVVSANVVADDFLIHSDWKTPGSSTILWSYSNPTLGSNYFTPDIHNKPPARFALANGSTPVSMTTVLSTVNPDVSPIVYPSSTKYIAVKNQIDNAPLAQTNFTLISTLGGFAPNTNNPITISSVTGSGAVAYANANSAGYITSIQFTSGGQGYYDNVSAKIGANSNVISLASETGAKGGPALAKYISRTVTLTPGFDANDLRVFVTAYKPAGTDIQVYFKVKSAQDPTAFDTSTWIRMITDNYLDSYEGDYTSAREYEFIAPETEYGYTGITYTKNAATYTNFNQFAIKIILLTNDTRKYPIAYDMRAIALPL